MAYQTRTSEFNFNSKQITFNQGASKTNTQGDIAQLFKRKRPNPEQDKSPISNSVNISASPQQLSKTNSEEIKEILKVVETGEKSCFRVKISVTYFTNSGSHPLGLMTGNFSQKMICHEFTHPHGAF